MVNFELYVGRDSLLFLPAELAVGAIEPAVVAGKSLKFCKFVTRSQFVKTSTHSKKQKKKKKKAEMLFTTDLKEKKKKRENWKRRNTRFFFQSC